MANNPTVTLTFAGDSKQVTRSSKEVGDATDQLRDKIDKNSTKMSRDTETSTDKIRRSQQSQQREYKQTAESFEDMVNRMVRERRRLDALNKNAASLGVAQHPVYGYVHTEAARDNGEDAGRSFMGGFVDSIKTTGARVLPYVAIGIGALLSRFIGSVGLLVGGGIVTGIGAGIVAAGMTVAAKSPEVIAHFERLKVNIQAKMMQISAPFKQTMIDAATAAQTVFNSIAPELDKVFPQAAQDVSEFIFNLQEGFRQLAPVIAPVMDAFGKILDSLGPQLPGVFQNIANALIPLAETVGENSDGFAAIVIWLLELIPTALKVINAMIEFGVWWDSVWDGVTGAIFDAGVWIGTTFQNIMDFAGRAASFVGDIFGKMGEAVSTRFQEMLKGVRDWPATIRATIGDFSRILWDAGWKLIGGLIDGIKARFGEVMSTLRGLTNSFPSWKGPADVDATLLVESGQLIIGGLISGLRSEEPNVRGYLDDLTKFIGGFGPSEGSLAAPVPSGASSRSERVIRFGSDGTRLGDAVLDLVQEAIRGRGGDPSVLGV